MKPTSEMRRAWPYAVVALAVVLGDQLTKWLAIANLTQAFFVDTGTLPLAERVQRFLWDRHPSRGRIVAVWDDFWHFRYVENPGAAWGLLAGESAAAFRTPFFLAISVLASVFLVRTFRASLPTQRTLRLGLALVFGGAVGNFLDRARLGYVIDFIDWHWYDRATWPTFNVADACITCGVVMLLLDMSQARPGERP